MEATPAKIKKWQTDGSLHRRFEDLDYSTTIWVLNATDGTYLKTITLPQPATQITINSTHIITLSLDEKRLPVIIGYKK